MRDVASVSMFVDFVFALFLDFAGCGTCFHPDVITLEQVRAETQLVESIAISEYTSGQAGSVGGQPTCCKRLKNCSQSLAKKVETRCIVTQFHCFSRFPVASFRAEPSTDMSSVL
jgi:hypothetical protein